MSSSRWSALVGLMLVCVPVAAQKLSVSAPVAVEAGESFRIEYRLEGGQADDFRGPTFTGCDVLAGPTMAQGSSMVMVNGTTQASVFEIYTYVLQAKTAGTKITGSSAVLQVGGKSVSSKALAIDVVSGGGASSGAAARSQRANPTAKVASDDVLLRMAVSKQSAYKGETIVATLKLYTRVGLSGLSAPKYPSFNGFWTQELDLGQVTATRETLGSKVYNVQPIRSWLLYPQKSGTLEVEQTSFTAAIQVVTQESSGNPFFDSFLGGGGMVQTVERSIVAPSVKVAIKELPSSGAPVGGTMAVGRFTLQSTLSTQEMTANSAATLRVTLDGVGDFPLVETPEFKLPQSFEQYDTKTEDKLVNSSAGTQGSRTWEFPFIARAEGSYTLPAVSITYFDPQTASYKKLTTPAYTLTVLRDPTGGRNSAAVVAGLNKEELQVVGSDVRHIKPIRMADLRASGNWWIVSVGYWLLYGVALGLAGGAIWFLRRTALRRADVSGRKRRRASKVAVARLKMAKKAMDEGRRGDFFDEITRALWGYAADKFEMPVSQLNKVNLRERLAERGVDEAVGQAWVALVERCELARYAPQGEVDMGQTYTEALDLIDRI